jgi:hypothetical protein
MRWHSRSPMLCSHVRIQFVRCQAAARAAWT